MPMLEQFENPNSVTAHFTFDALTRPMDQLNMYLIKLNREVVGQKPYRSFILDLTQVHRKRNYDREIKVHNTRMHVIDF